LSITAETIMFYGTDPFYDMLWDHDSGHLRVCMIDEESKVRPEDQPGTGLFPYFKESCINYNLLQSRQRDPLFTA